MATYRFPVGIVLLSLLLSACDGGSSSNRSSARTANEPPAPAPPPAGPPIADYTMPPLVEVLPPETDFELACQESVPPVDAAPPSPADDAVAGANSGSLIDAAVSGVAWMTPTLQGVTDAEGRFQYEDGETVRFMLGDTSLGEVPGKARVTPFDLAGSKVLTGMPAITAALEDDEHPFHTVISTAMLLQSLDEDGDPANGIAVTPEVAALLAGVNLDTRQRWQTFQDEYWLSHTLAAANAQDLFSAPHGLVNPARALGHLYSTLGIDAGTVGIILEENDWDADGAIEEVTRLQYDADGHLALREYSDYDGLRSLERWSYDANGKLALYNSEEFGHQFAESWEYDDAGNLTLHEVDDNGDGSPEQSDNWSYEYTTDGKILHAKIELFDANNEEDVYSASTVDFQYASDGRLLRIEFKGEQLHDAADQFGIFRINYLEFAQGYTVTYRYDASGSLVEEVHYGFNKELGEYTVVRHFDLEGNVIRQRGELITYSSSENPQVTLEEYGYEYDARGNVTRKWFVDSDGSQVDVTRYDYDEQGNVVRERVYSDEDGSIESTTRFAYDNNGNLTREITDWDGDGSPNMIVINKYDDQGNVVFTEMDHDGDGIIDFSYGSPYEYEFDDQGRVTRQAQYQEGSSQPGEIYTFTYHANGQLARRTSWSTDGDHRASSAWVYDATGRLLQEELDSSAGGVAQRTISYRYDTCGSLQQRRSFNIEGGEIHTEGWQHDSAGYLRRYNWEDTPLNIAGDELPELTEELYSSGFENWQYDTQGRPIRYQSQCEGNCFAYEYSIESRENLVSNREYNASGQLIRELTDLDNDGRADRVTVFEYDAGGRVTRALSDEDGDGRADTVDSYTFDKGGKLRRHETDYGADGTADSVDVVKYDSHGNVTFEESDYNSDGIPDNTSTFSHEYDAAGNHTRMEEDYDSDGIVDYVINREFDSNGRLLREETDEMADGMPESVQTYEYDAAGNLVRETQERDHTGDGVMNETTTREYSPTGWGHILDEGYP